MDPVTALAITSLGLGLFASVTSCFTCIRTERYMRRSECDTTSIEIDNSVIDREEADGTVVHERNQHIRIDDIETSTFTGRSTTVETGRENGVASTLAAAASGGLSAISGVLPIGLPGSSTTATPVASRGVLPRSESQSDILCKY